MSAKRPLLGQAFRALARKSQLLTLGVSLFLLVSSAKAQGFGEPESENLGGAAAAFREPTKSSGPSQSPPASASKHEAAPSTPEQATQGDAEAAKRLRDRRSLRMGGRRVYEFLTAHGALTPEARARSAEKALRQVVEIPDTHTVAVKLSSHHAVLSCAGVEILRLTEKDAKLAEAPSLADHAGAVADLLTDTIHAEKKRRKIATTIFAVSLAALLALAALLLVRKTGELARRAHTWIENHGDRFGSISFQSTEVLSRATVKNAAFIAVELSKWLARLLVLYFGVLFTLLLFEGSRAYAKQLTGVVLSPVYQLTARVAASLPLLVVALFAIGVLAVLLRFIDLFFQGVVRGETALSWISPELARPTSVLVRVGLCLAALLFVAPVVTGEEDGALHELVIALLFALSLSAVPLLSSAVVGLYVVFGRRLTPGDFVEFGGTLGRVIQVGLLETRLEVDDGTEVRVPQLLSLWHRTRSLGPRPRIAVEISLEDASEEACLSLQKLARHVGDRPLVEILSIQSGAVRLRVSVSSARPDAKNALSLSLLEFLKTRANQNPTPTR